MTEATPERPAEEPVPEPARPFTMLAGDPEAMVCEGDVCLYVPPADSGR